MVTDLENTYGSLPFIPFWIKIDLPDGQMTHCLRHTFASHFMQNGGDILVLKEILGHSSIVDTMKYAHFSPKHLADAISKNPMNELN